MKKISQDNNNKLFRTDHLMGDLKGRSVRGGGITLVANLTKFALRLVSTVILARLLTPYDYGLIAMVVAITGFVAIFKDAGLSMATLQSEVITHQQISTLFWFNVLVSITLMVITLLLAPIIALFYRESKLVNITYAYGLLFIISGLTIQHQALLTRQMRFKTLGMIRIISMLTGIFASISIAYYFRSYWAIVALQGTNELVTMMGSWIAIRWVPGRPHWGKDAWRMIKFGGNISASAAINYFARSGDKFLIGWKFGPAELGYYSRAYALLMIPVEQILGPITSVMIPMLSRLQNNMIEYRRVFLRMFRTMAFILMPATTVVFVISRPIILVLLGPKWEPVSDIFKILAIAALYYPLASMLSWIYITQDRTATLLKVGIINSTVSLVSFVMGLPWGALGVATAFTISGIFVRFPVDIYYAGSKGPIKRKDLVYGVIRQLPICLIIGLVCQSTYLWLAGNYAIVQILGCVFSGLVVFFMACIIFPGKKRELQDLIGAIKQFIIRRQRVPDPV